jgi:lipopolysaccharide transport system ATP-binding protein
MSDVARQGRTVLFVSHNMSAILRLTQETMVLDRGSLVLRAPSPQAVDYYMTSGLAQTGERRWAADEVPASARPFRPLALRVRDERGRIAERVACTESFSVEFEYELSEEISGLRTGLYLSTGRGEPVLTSFDTDAPQAYERHLARPAGRYLSRCRLPASQFNEGLFVLGVNASSFRIRSYFTDEHALSFSIDGTGAPGSHWPETRSGPLRPALAWEIEAAG